LPDPSARSDTSDPAGRPPVRVNRRVFVRGALAAAGAAALAGAGYAGARWSRPTPSPSAGDPGVMRFRSRPDLAPPSVNVTGPAVGSPGYIFVTPKTFEGQAPGQLGEMIVDTRGDLVWFRETLGTPMNLRVQRYRGEPVLTWWEGRAFHGHGQGTCHVLDTSYREISTIRGHAPLYPDLHEFRISPQDTALVTSYRDRAVDLSTLGGKTEAPGYESLILEIDIATGEILWVWHSLDHVSIEETALTLEIAPHDRPFDYFHINSIDVLPDGDLLVSARNTNAVYRVARASGDIVWRLGGKKSDFAMSDNAHFFWQHHASWAGKGLVTVFDNADAPQMEAQSRALVLSLDERLMRATVHQSLQHPARLLCSNQGSVQSCSGGRTFVGWGDEPYFTLFDDAGSILLDGRFPEDKQSYRAFLQHWGARPQDPPVLAVGSNPPAGVTVYASWNGATEVHSWRVLAGAQRRLLRTVGEVPRSGFETAIAVNDKGPYFGVVALDATGQELARSAVTRT
jgi:hypothetical protein